MKIRVVMFCTLPLVAPSQKNTCFDPSDHLKNGKCIFYVETEKTLVAEVVGNAKMHISTKNGTKGSHPKLLGIAELVARVE
jgi:hypothetical protein